MSALPNESLCLSETKGMSDYYEKGKKHFIFYGSVRFIYRAFGRL